MKKRVQGCCIYMYIQRERERERTMGNLPPVAFKVDPTNESSWIISLKPRIVQGDVAVSFSVQPHGPSSKEQCEPSGRLSTMQNKKQKPGKQEKLDYGRTQRAAEVKTYCLSYSISAMWFFDGRLLIGLICLFPESPSESQHFASGAMWDFAGLSPALKTLQNCSSHNLKSGKPLTYVCKGFAAREIAGIKKFSLSF